MFILKKICSIAAIILSITFANTAKSEIFSDTMKRRRVAIIGLDGTTGNQLHHRVWAQNLAPNLRNLMLTGKFTICESDQDNRCARTHSGHSSGLDYFWLTGPGWASVLTGVDNLRHGVKDNDDKSLRAFSKSTKQFPSLFMRAKMNGLKTAAAGVGAFLTSRKKDKSYFGVTDYECGYQQRGPSVAAEATQSCNLDNRQSFNSTDPNRDNLLTKWFVDRVNDSNFDITMGVYDMIDTVGHANGFDNNDKYLQAITTADVQIGTILNAIKKRADNFNEEWLILLTSDHGGHRLLFWGNHGRMFDEDEVIPFVVAVVGSDQKLSNLKYPVSHMDVHPTVMQWFGLNSSQVDGHIQGL